MMLLFKDYFQRYGKMLLALLAGIAALRFAASFVSEETHISFWSHRGVFVGAGLLERLLFLLSVLSLAATVTTVKFGYFLAILGFMLAMGMIGEKWPRLALTFPVSRRAIALTLWLNCVLIPSLFAMAGAFIILAIGVSGVFALEGPNVSLLKIFVASICFTGTACLSVQTVDALAHRIAGSNVRRTLDLLDNVSILFTTFCFVLFLICLGFTFERWPDFRVRDIVFIAAGLGMTGLSFYNRQTLLYLFEPFHVKTRSKELAAPHRDARRSLRRIPGFFGSYTRVARRTLATTLVLCCLSLPFSFIQMQHFLYTLMAGHGRRLKDGDLLISDHADGVFFFFVFSGLPIIMSIICTPPLRVCRVLPLNALQLSLRLLTCPAVIFTVFTLTVLPFILIFTEWDVVHALAILNLAFGFVVFFIGLEALLTETQFGMTLFWPFVALVCSFFLFGPVVIDLIEAVVHAPSILAMLGLLFFVIGNVVWYRGIAYASPAYRTSPLRDQGKIVL